MVPSLAEVVIVLLSEENFDLVIAPRWPLSVCKWLPLLSHTLTVLSSETVKMYNEYLKHSGLSEVVAKIPLHYPNVCLYLETLSIVVRQSST